MEFILLIAGILIGSIVTQLFFWPSRVGTLRIDRSDPKDGPYIFLELNKGVGDISAKKIVVLQVDNASYIPRN